MDVTDYVIVLNDDAVKAFAGGGQLTLGAEAALSFGPIGRSASGAFAVSGQVNICSCFNVEVLIFSTCIQILQSGVSMAYSYSQSRGFFAGLCLDASVILPRVNVNQNFYGMVHDIGHILTGGVPQPNAAKQLYETLTSTLAVSEARSARPNNFVRPAAVVQLNV